MKRETFRRTVGRIAAVVVCLLAILPSAATASLSLRIGERPDPVPENMCLPGTYFLDLIFTETPPTENEGLFAYDLGLRLVRPSGQTGGVRLTGAERPDNFVLGDDTNKSTFTIATNTADELLINVVSNNDLFDITSGKKAARIFYTIDAPPRVGQYRIIFDTATTVFGSGNPNRPDVIILVHLTDGGDIIVCPEPGGLGLVGWAGLFALRRRRGGRRSIITRE